ncbi:MAG: hypothetical protein IH605_08800, partial [Burkholderiales bacterium]|nr:hypothetical protein [Burkholderiales bacterium]
TQAAASRIRVDEAARVITEARLASERRAEGRASDRSAQPQESEAAELEVGSAARRNTRVVSRGRKTS